MFSLVLTDSDAVRAEALAASAEFRDCSACNLASSALETALSRAIIALLVASLAFTASRTNFSAVTGAEATYMCEVPGKESLVHETGLPLAFSSRETSEGTCGIFCKISGVKVEELRYFGVITRIGGYASSSRIGT